MANTGKEAQILVRGLNQLYDQGLHDKYIIGDGDSNVFNNLASVL